MQDHSQRTRQIAKNTLMLYGRMLFSMVVSLYTSRVVLNTLGVVDYGVYSVVGGFVSMFSIISSSLSSSVSRFLTFELGQGDKERLAKAFSISLLIHIALAILVFIVAETIGIWFVNNKMTIPINRLNAANWVFHSSTFAFMFGLLGVPYTASIVSHEKMNAFAYIGIFDTILKLSIVLFIAYSSWRFDRLIVYSILLTAESVLLQGIYISYCRKHFQECNLKISFDKELWKGISSFAGWNFIGCAAAILKDQGVNVLINLFIGPILNAARSVAGSVNNAVSGFVGNFMTALTPQITKSFAKGDIKFSHYLMEKGSRFSFYILMYFTIPIILETDIILKIWLKQCPEHSSNFVRLVLILSMVDCLSNTLITLQHAVGNIRNYQLVVGSILLLNFPLSYIFLKLGFGPESTYIVAISVAVICLIVRLLFVKKSTQLSVVTFLKNVVLNVSMVFISAYIVPYLLHVLIPYGWLRLFVVGSVSVFSTTVAILFVGCSSNERSFIIEKFITFVSGIRK